MTAMPLSNGWDLVVNGRQQRRVFSLPETGLVTIGRAPRCDLRLDDDSVSREHARLYLPSFEIEDLDSRNGSWILETAVDLPRGALLDLIESDGFRLMPRMRRRLRPGMLLMLGNVVTHLQPSAPASRTLPVEAPHDSEAPVLEDQSMIDLYELAERGAATHLPLLILGETGVGKDVLAARIHEASPRKQGPFVRINCGALSESLLESELFGHQRGAFTGANESKAGLFEVANGGSVFLDEIGELPLRTQVKLLHVLETNQVTRVGSTKAQRIDVRFIAATNRELARDVQAGGFRKDLYFRLNTLCLEIKPLRERRADILPLARHFLRRACAASGLAAPELPPETIQHLEEYSWPGNVRELKNSMDRACILSRGGPLLPQHFPTQRELVNRAPEFFMGEAEESTRIVQRTASGGMRVAAAASPAEVIEALNKCGGNQTRAAQVLGVSRRTLVNRLNQYNLRDPRKQGS
jgi:two-component system, NtrC family, response regulator AtoC